MHKWQQDRIDKLLNDTVDERSTFDDLCEMVVIVAIIYFVGFFLRWWP